MDNREHIVLRIVFVTCSLGCGGTERAAVTLANTFVEQGDEVSIVVQGSGPSHYKTEDGVDVSFLELEGKTKNPFKRLALIRKRIKMLGKTVDAFNPDIVMCMTPRLTGYVILGSNDRTYPVIGAVRANPNNLICGLSAPIDRYFFSLADAFLFQTEGARACFSGRITASSGVIPNSLPEEFVSKAVPRFEERDLKSICAVGRLDSTKDQATLLRAFALFAEAHNGYTLTLYGDGPERKRLKNEAVLLDISDSVTFAGPVKGTQDAIINKGMFVHSSISEGMPNALLEAMACGLPCVATDCDFGPRDLIRDNVNGLLVPVGDFAAMAEAMGHIADDEGLARRLSENALEVRYTHNGITNAREYHTFFEKTILNRDASSSSETSGSDM